MELVGKIIDNSYKIIANIAEDGISKVYLARRIKDKKDCVLKILKQEINSLSTENIIRFRKEAITVSKLNHQNIIKVYEIGEFKGLHYIVMERITGKSLYELQRDGFCFSENDIVELICQVCDALSHVHNYGVIHRDLKPVNIIMQNTGNRPIYKILDFGLVELIEFSKITAKQEIIGTFGYMSPEQSGMVKKPVDERSDLYSLGIIVYQLLTGKLPFKGKDISTILHQHIAKIPESPRKLNKDIPPIFEKIVLKLLKKEPEERYQTARGLFKDLLRYKSGKRDFVLGTEDILMKLPYHIRMRGREEEFPHFKNIFE